MKKIAIIGGGIIGMTLANYLDPQKFDITVYDEGLGQATKASAGIISCLLYTSDAADEL